MVYDVTIAFEGRYIVGVEAESIEEARKKAESEFMFADLNESDDIFNDRAVIVEDEDGEIVWEE